jgi:phosphohistidine phosphatase SixA
VQAASWPLFLLAAKKECVAMKALVYLVVLATVGAARAQPPSPAELLPELRKGGYVLFIRHPKTNPDQADTDPLHLDNVKAQRQLSDEGRKQARALGEAFRALKIPVGKVISSKFFRAQEAAKLLGLGEVTASVDVTEGGLVVSPRENERRAKALRELLSATPPDGKNVVIVSHKPNLQDAAGKDFGDLREAEVVVFKPLGEGKFKVVARVGSPEIWSKWAK